MEKESHSWKVNWERRHGGAGSGWLHSSAVGKHRAMGGGAQLALSFGSAWNLSWRDGAAHIQVGSVPVS